LTLTVALQGILIDIEQWLVPILGQIGPRQILQSGVKRRWISMTDGYRYRLYFRLGIPKLPYILEATLGMDRDLTIAIGMTLS
jgi:hypothetical protein